VAISPNYSRFSLNLYHDIFSYVILKDIVIATTNMIKLLQKTMLWGMLFFAFSIQILAQPCDNPLAQANPCMAPVICNGTLINNYCGSKMISPYIYSRSYKHIL
jgi:hypothetical protein